MGGRCQDDHQHQGVVDEFFNSEVNLLNFKEVGEHGVQLEIGIPWVGIPLPGEHWICLSATECGGSEGPGGRSERGSHLLHAEIQGLHNTYFSWVEVIYKQFFRITAAALTCAIPAVVLFLFCTSWVLWVAGFCQPKASSPWSVGYFCLVESESRFCL